MTIEGKKEFLKKIRSPLKKGMLLLFRVLYNLLTLGRIEGYFKC